MTAATIERTTTSPTPRAGFRPEIQGLRAFAVAAVVLYHVWPTAIPGGYTGVDVFFVVSGFLITGHLVQQAASQGGISLTRFWARRIRRLLPAAFTVLLVCLALTVAFLPRAVWVQNFREIFAAGAYVLNWLLANDSVDYLAAENAPSLVQHYWSLSLEEQFYVAWPLMLVAALGLTSLFARRSADPARTRLRAIVILLAVVTAASFVWSIVAVAADPSPAYFSTLTRVWEFGAGGLLAVLAGRVAAATPSRVVGTIASWTGLAMLLATVFLYSRATPFPGLAAALPVVGTLAIMWAGSSAAGISPNRASRVRPVQFIGDVSYSAYLWHWPIVVVVLDTVGEINVPVGIAILVATLVLAWATKKWIEDPVRLRKSWSSRRAPAYRLLAGGMVVVLGLSGGGILLSRAQATAQATELTKHIACIGAATFVTDDVTQMGCADPAPDDAVYPSAETRADDTAGQYSCYMGVDAPLKSCTYGDKDSTTVVALVGDSHAASLLPGLIPVFERNGWRLDTYVGRDCRLYEGNGSPCGAFPDIVEQLESGRYDYVLATGLRRFEDDKGAIRTLWTRLSQLTTLVAIADVPYFPQTTLDCVNRAGNDLAELALCTTPREVGLEEYPDNPLEVARELGLPTIDFSDDFCTQTECPSVIGQVFVYRDSPYSHITATFSRTMTAALTRELKHLISG